MSTVTITARVEKSVFDALEELGVEREDLTRDAEFEQLHIDSLDLVELRQMMKEEWSVEIVKEDIIELKNLGDVIDYVAARVS